MYISYLYLYHLRIPTTKTHYRNTPQAHAVGAVIQVELGDGADSPVRALRIEMVCSNTRKILGEWAKVRGHFTFTAFLLYSKACSHACTPVEALKHLRTLFHSTFNPVQGHGVLTSASPEQATDNSHFNLSFLSTASLYWIAPWSVAKETDVNSVSGVCFLGYFVTHPQM